MGSSSMVVDPCSRAGPPLYRSAELIAPAVRLTTDGGAYRRGVSTSAMCDDASITCEEGVSDAPDKSPVPAATGYAAPRGGAVRRARLGRRARRLPVRIAVRLRPAGMPHLGLPPGRRALRGVSLARPGPGRAVVAAPAVHRPARHRAVLRCDRDSGLPRRGGPRPPRRTLPVRPAGRDARRPLDVPGPPGPAAAPRTGRPRRPGQPRHRLVDPGAAVGPTRGPGP